MDKKNTANNCCLFVTEVFLFLFLLQTSFSYAEWKPIKTKEGIFQKVIVGGAKKGSNSSNLYEKPNRSSNIIDGVEPMSFLFLLSNETNKAQRNGFYSVGYSPRDGDYAGWIHESEVVEWNNREVARFAPRMGRAAACIYESDDSLEMLLRKGVSPELPISKEPPEAIPGQKFKWLLPILKSKTLNVNNERSKIFRLAYMQMPRKTFQNKNLNKKNTSSLSAKDFKLDVVFVIDGTSSMKPFFPIVKNTVEQLGKKVFSLRERGIIRLGLWVYRDRVEDEEQGELGKVVEKILSVERGEDVQNFLHAIEKVRISNISSGDHAEAMLEGLYFALNDTQWSPRGLRIIILIGDSSGHAGDYKNPHELSVKRIIDRAHENRVRISALVLPGETAGDAGIFKHQAQTLCTGSGIAMSGVFDFIQNLPSLDKMKIFEKKVYELLVREAQRLDELKSVDLKKENISRYSPKNQEIILLNLKASSDPHAQDFKKQFSTGWVRGKIHGINVLSTHVLISNKELEVMNIYLRSVQDWAGSISDQLDYLTIKTLDATLGEASQHDAKISDFLSKKTGLPVYTTLLKLTRNEIRSMSQRDKLWLIKSIHDKRAVIDSYLNDLENWIPLGSGSQYNVAFIPIDLLP